MSISGIRQARTRRRRFVLTGALAVTLGLFLLRALIGDYPIALVDAVRIIGGEDLGVANFIFLEAMLPMALAGLATGLGLGASGAAFQAMLRNPLASPDVVGVTLGASAAAVTGTILFGLDSTQATVAAFAGALIVAAAIYLLSGGARSASNRIILIGVGLAAGLTALIHFALTQASVYQAADAMRWLSGSLGSITWDDVARIWLVSLVCLPLLFALARPLRLVETGDDIAGGLGVRVPRVRLAVLIVVVALTATITSVAGPVAFVGLLAGPIARLLNQGRSSLPLAGVVGAAVVLAADYLGSVVMDERPLPVGVITGALGAPMLIVLLWRGSAKERLNG